MVGSLSLPIFRATKVARRYVDEKSPGSLRVYKRLYVCVLGELGDKQRQKCGIRSDQSARWSMRQPPPSQQSL